ncbi:MAG: proline iminopeptidase-family hydrolase [Chitinophagaceae bacterium]
MKRLRTGLLLGCIIALVIASCNQQPLKESVSLTSEYFQRADSGLQTGGIRMIPITTPKGTFNVWTKRFGYNPSIKVLLLNGGPGATHEYFECFESFLPAEGIEFIYYDQLACGNSDNPNDTSLYDLPRYVEEVEQIREALHLDSNNFYLLGHSWGGIMAMEYALKYQQHLKGLVISNMMCDIDEYVKYANDVLAKQMDPKVLDTIRQLEAKKDFENPKYMELLMPNFYAEHILRLPPQNWPEPVNRSFSKMNHTLYVNMQGPSEFGASGKLLHWSRKNDLKSITVPTLVIGAHFDTMDPEHMRWMSKEVKNGSFLLCPNGGHMCMYDDQQTYMKGFIKFLQETNKGKKTVSL